ncbi:HU family DNA-binding protein [Bacteroides caecimuris]|uniref:HU family DNA-binding protein n=1 Tax=Bacteroides caecimuris TaxID=1796613 RepID=UPI0025722A0A|nr:HU family DNA-binding protein [Bacteroides caecimuris]
MNERLTIQDLTDLLAAKHSMTKKDAEAFVKEFFLLIEQALENEKTVKIKGLGTFKLIDVDSRESVNVNTGERFQIKGHTKVSFSPDTNLRDTINKPFAHFETVVLNENTILEDTPIEDTEEEEAEEETSAQTVLNEVGEGIAPLVTEEYESTDDELSEKELIQEEQITAQPSVKDSIEESVIIENVSTVEESIEPSSHVGLKETSTETDIEEKVEQLKDEEVPEEEVAIVEQEPTVPIIPSAKKETIKPVKLEQVSQPTSKKTASVKEKSPVPYLIAVIVIVLLLCGGVILFIYYPDLFSSSSDNNALDMPPVTTQPVQQETQLSDTIEQKDTIKEITPDAPKVVTPTSPVAQKEGTVPAKAEPQPAPRQPATSVYLDSASYKITGTKTKYTIKEGETLTKVSLRFYGTKAMWPYIVKHNPKAIKNPNNVPYGTIIEIPELTKE